MWYWVEYVIPQCFSKLDNIFCVARRTKPSAFATKGEPLTSVCQGQDERIRTVSQIFHRSLAQSYRNGRPASSIMENRVVFWGDILYCCLL